MWAEKYAYKVMTKKGVRERRALWIPDANLLIQWVPLGKAPQVTHCEAFPPSDQKARYHLVEKGTVPFSFVEEARRNLFLTEKNRGQMKAISQAVRRISAHTHSLDARMAQQLEGLTL